MPLYNPLLIEYEKGDGITLYYIRLYLRRRKWNSPWHWRGNLPCCKRSFKRKGIAGGIWELRLFPSRQSARKWGFTSYNQMELNSANNYLSLEEDTGLQNTAIWHLDGSLVRLWEWGERLFYAWTPKPWNPDSKCTLY